MRKILTDEQLSAKESNHVQTLNREIRYNYTRECRYVFVWRKVHEKCTEYNTRNQQWWNSCALSWFHWADGFN